MTYSELRRQHLRTIGASMYNMHGKKEEQVVRHVSEQKIGIANVVSFQQVLQGCSLSLSWPPTRSVKYLRNYTHRCSVPGTMADDSPTNLIRNRENWTGIIFSIAGLGRELTPWHIREVSEDKKLPYIFLRILSSAFLSNYLSPSSHESTRVVVLQDIMEE